nr:unnamed protein product [uncultured bacterium]
MPQNCLDRLCSTSRIKIGILQRCLLLLSLLWLFSSFLIALGIRTDAEAPTSVFQHECQLHLDGHFIYLYSDSNYTPVNNLNGTDHVIYFSAESEKCLLWESDTNYGISNASQTTINGFTANYPIRIEFGDTVSVYQPHRTSSSSTRDAWAYYRVSVNNDDISTDLLYRSERSNTFITYLIVGICLIVLYTIFKMLRRER